MSEGKVLVELTIAAPVDEVWRALRDPVEIEQWFGWDASTLQEEIKYIFFDHATADEAARTIAFDGMADRFEVIDQGDHCLVRLVRAGAAGDESDWDGVYEDVTEGWLAFLTQLRFALERRRGERRRTLYLSVRSAERPAPSTRGLLGLSETAAIPLGGAYAIDTGLGEPLEGQVWSRSRRQLGLTVNAYGDGLVLATDRSGGGGSVIVSTYGLSDAAFEQLRRRWSDWWSQCYPDASAPATATEPAC